MVLVGVRRRSNSKSQKQEQKPEQSKIKSRVDGVGRWSDDGRETLCTCRTMVFVQSHTNRPKKRRKPWGATVSTYYVFAHVFCKKHAQSLMYQRFRRVHVFGKRDFSSAVQNYSIFVSEIEK